MPDLIFAFTRQWKFIIGTSVLVALIALIASLLSTKQYLSVATALPVNTALSDKARIFNNNIEGLYPALGTPDDLDRIEGTAKLDTIFIAVVHENKMAAHYGFEDKADPVYNAVEQLQRNTKIVKSAYGELQVKVWDENKNMAATLANSLLQQLQNLHQHLHQENNKMILSKLTAAYNQQAQVDKINDQATQDSANNEFGTDNEQLKQYRQLINEYQLVVNASPKILLTVETARPSAKPDKPRTAQMVLFSFVAALACTFLLSLFINGKRTNA